MSAISALIIIIFVLFIIASAVLGFKNGARRSVYGLAANLITALSAFILSLILKKPLSTLLYRPVSSKITDKLGYLSDESSILVITRQISISITSILLFIGIYIIIRSIYGICMLVRKIYIKNHLSTESIPDRDVTDSPITDSIDIGSDESIPDKFSRRLTPSSMGGVIICTISCIISAIIILFPVAGGTRCLADSLNETASHSESSRKYSSIERRIDPFSGNIVLRGVYSCGGRFLFDRFTNINYEDSKVSLSSECNNMAVLYILSSVVRDSSYANTPERVAAAESSKIIFDRSELIPDIAVEVIQTGAHSFTDKESFLGMQLPESNEKIKSLYLDMMNTCANTSPENIKVSLNSFIDISETMIRYDAMNRIKNNDTALSLFGDDGFLKDFMLAIYDDNNLRSYIPRIANTGLSMAFESVDLPTKSITDNAITIDDMSRNDVAKEAELLSRVIHNINSISHNIDSDSDKVENAELLSATVDELYDSHFFKQITKALLLSVITSYSQNNK